MPETTPAYLRIAALLRTQITSGELAPGDQLPSETELMAEHGVSRTVAKWAISVLKGEGLVEGRRGSGVYVRTIRRIVRESHGRNARSKAPDASTSPFARDAQAAGHAGGWEHHSAHDTADAVVAARLGISPGDAVMRSAYRFIADGSPIQLSTSWEPLSVTGGTPVEWPEEGAAVGVVARMDTIGVRIDETIERVTARAATSEEIERLGLPARGAYVLVIERTYLAAGNPVETADIVFPGDRYELVYRVPVD
ncbi:GntR family transcriptional regulator [Luedemannella helvata]|uniref:GntR family transcriptional regulator n=1 Tax=Luedemannella helvata TaxID=349315 RepID=A0ABN2KUL2_9ACTN